MSRFRAAFSHIKTFPTAFWVVIGATLINQIGNMAIVFLVLYLNQYLNFTLTQASFAFALFSASMLVTGLFGGNLIDKIGAGFVMTTSLLANGVVMLFFPLIHHYLPILFICMLWGFSFGLYRPASQTFIAHLSAAGMHKVTFSVYRLVLNLGMSIGPVLGGILASYSYAWIFIGNGIANLLASMMLIAGLINSAWFKYRPLAQQKSVLSIKWLKRDSILRWFVMGMVPVSMVFFQCESTLAVYLKTDLGLALSFYGLLFTINTLIIVFCELPLNIATMHWPYRVNFMLGSLLITLGFAGLYFATFKWHIILLTVFWTIGEMILYPAASSYIADIATPEQRGSYMSISTTCSNLGMLLGPWGGAVIMEHWGAKNLWIMCGVWGLLSVFIFNYLKEPSRNKS